MPRSYRTNYYLWRSLSRSRVGRAYMYFCVMLLGSLMMIVLGMLAYAIVFKGLWVIFWDLFKGFFLIIWHAFA